MLMLSLPVKDNVSKCIVCGKPVNSARSLKWCVSCNWNNFQKYTKENVDEDKAVQVQEEE